MTRIELLNDDQLAARRDKAAAAGDWPVAERCEAEMERRDLDASDPASPQNTREDTPALGSPWWEQR